MAAYVLEMWLLSISAAWTFVRLLVNRTEVFAPLGTIGRASMFEARNTVVMARD
jgi:hypothetical protein